MEEVTLTADTGRPVGSGPSRRLRTDGKVPGVLYGHGMAPVALAVDARQLRGALSTAAGANVLITLDVSGDRHLAMARQLQRHPVRGGVTHVDFVIVRRDEVISTDVPVHLVGEAEAVHRGDGYVDQSLFSLTIMATPANIPASVEVDISGLGIGDAVRVGDLKLPEGVTTDIDPEEQVVAGQAPQAEAPAAGAETAEGEAPAEAAGDEGGAGAAPEEG